MSATTGMLSQADLERRVAAGEIDTVIVAFCDMQGRLTGKRVSARLFVDDVAEHGAECCNYLLAVDVDMNTVDGYSISSWETGYGDMVMTPDFTTLRLLPWLPGTALVMADLSWTRRQARDRRRPEASSTARSTGSPSTAWCRMSARSWSSWCSTSATDRPGPTATAD